MCSALATRLRRALSLIFSHVPALAPEFVPSPLLATLLVLECLFLLAGGVILFRRRRSALARFLGLAPAGIATAPYRASEIFLAAACAFGGALVGQTLAMLIGGKWFPKPEGVELGLFDVIAGAGLQLGVLAGLAHAWFWHLRPSRRAAAARRYEIDAAPALATPEPAPAPPPVSLGVALREGASTFVTLLPVVGLSSYLWNALLHLLGIEAAPQDLVTLFADTGDHLALTIIIVLAVLVAPVAEELVFRIGLFRWLRTRAPRTVVLFAPALVFALLHGNLAVFVPLVILAVCLALAYERVGHPLVPIVAHALFNLNTLVLLLAGLPT